MLVDATVNLRESDGTLIQDLSAGGYWVGPVDVAFTKRKDQYRSAYVSGWSTTSSVLDGAILSFTVRCEGATWADVEGLRAALEGWVVETWHYKVEVVAEGVSTTYEAEDGEMGRTKPLDAPTIANCADTFLVSIPVQPYPAVTGLP